MLCYLSCATHSVTVMEAVRAEFFLFLSKDIRRFEHIMIKKCEHNRYPNIIMMSQLLPVLPMGHCFREQYDLIKFDLCHELHICLLLRLEQPFTVHVKPKDINKEE